ncbi:unnamed protein product [Pylaiella littoralis]
MEAQHFIVFDLDADAHNLETFGATTLSMVVRARPLSWHPWSVLYLCCMQSSSAQEHNLPSCTRSFLAQTWHLLVPLPFSPRVVAIRLRGESGRTRPAVRTPAPHIFLM